MKIEFIDADTGEVLQEWKEGCLEIEVPDTAEQPDEQWLPDWYMKRLLQIAAQREIIEAQHRVRLEALKRKERSLKWRYEERLEAVVRAEIAGGRKRSVDFAYGTAGLRRSKRIKVHDEDDAIRWAWDNAPKAVKSVTKTTLYKSALPANVEIPGVERIEEERFYVRFPKGGE